MDVDLENVILSVKDFRRDYRDSIGIKVHDRDWVGEEKVDMAELRISLSPSKLRFTRIELAIIKAATPIKTGKLRRGWRIDANGDLVNRVEYSEFVEFGTRHMSARHFVKKTMAALIRSVTIRVLMTTPEGQKLMDAITLNVKRAGSFQAIYRNTINPKFYRHLVRGVAAQRREQRSSA